MDQVAYLQTMDRCNRWMNERLYPLRETLSHEERERCPGAFFRSNDGTPNPHLVGDRIRLNRVQRREPSVPSPAREIHSDFAELSRQRRRTERLDRPIAGAIRWTRRVPLAGPVGVLACNVFVLDSLQLASGLPHGTRFDDICASRSDARGSSIRAGFACEPGGRLGASTSIRYAATAMMPPIIGFDRPR
jgi:hypothetical protein